MSPPGKGVDLREVGLARASAGVRGGENGSSSERAVGRGKSAYSLKSDPSFELASRSRTRESASLLVSRLVIVKQRKRRFLLLVLYDQSGSYAMRACAAVGERESSCACPLDPVILYESPLRNL